MQVKSISVEAKLILAFMLLKLGIHFLTNTNYELHRDAFLYLALADHLDFGYITVPPMIALLTRSNELLFGTSTFAVRLLPTIFGVLSVGLIGKLVKALGGKTWAIFIACSSFILSPAFLRSNMLLQPVSLNQFFWLLLSYLVIKLVSTNELKYWFYIGLVVGFGFLTKYSILFPVVAYLVALIISPYRKLILSREFVWSVIIALIIMSPNLVWQAMHNWPVVSHMAELQETQLVNVNYGDFIAMQFLMNMPSIFVWLWALIFLFFVEKGKSYRFVGYTFFIIT